MPLVAIASWFSLPRKGVESGDVGAEDFVQSGGGDAHFLQGETFAKLRHSGESRNPEGLGKRGPYYQSEGLTRWRGVLQRSLLVRQTADVPNGVQVDGSIIDPARVRSVQYSKLAGLQVADAVATGVHYALKPNRYGETESAYFSHIAKTLYWRNDEALGYGMKFWPEDYEAMKTKIPQIEDLEDLLH